MHRIIRLDGDWAFTYQPDLQPGTIPRLPAVKTFRARMPVPGFWDDHLSRLRRQTFWPRARFNPDYRPIRFPAVDRPPDASLPYLLGVGWYRRVITVPETWRGRAAILSVGGVVLEAWVWLDRKLVAQHVGHSTPWEVDLSGRLQAGARRELVIAVANTRRDRIGCDIRGYAGCSGGIYRPVFLKITAGPVIRDVYVRPEPGLKNLRWRAELGHLPAGRRLRLAYRLADPETGRPALTGVQPVARPVVEWKTSARGLRPWSDHDPKLYRLECHLKRGSETVDHVSQAYGMRLLERRGIALRLNRQPIYLRGVCEHAYFPLTCTPPADPRVYRRNIRRLQALGFNWLRCHTWVPREEYLQAADELGLLVQVEPPVGFDAGQWVDILRTCRKHPSAVIYCCGNEECLDEPKIARLRRLAALCRQWAPDARFNPQEALNGVEYGPALGRAAVAQPYPHNPRRLERLKQFSDVFGQYAWGHLSYNPSIRGNWRVVDARLKPYQRPCLAHEVGIVGTYLDLGLEKRYAGTRIGTGLYAAARRHLARAGLAGRAARYYRNSCAWARVLRKFNLETTRLCRREQGYDYLSAYDQHWPRGGYPCGIMNEFYELKPGESAADVRRYNGESVLLLDCGPRRVFASGARVALDLHVSFFRPRPLLRGRLEWRLLGPSGELRCRGRWPVPRLDPGAVRKIGVIRFSLSAASAGQRLTLQARLVGQAWQIENTWDLWVFPAPGPVTARLAVDAGIRQRLGASLPGQTAEADGRADPALLQVVSSLKPEVIAGLAAGGAVVLLGHEPLPSLPTEFHSCAAGRVRGNLATVIEDHPLMRMFPHDGFCDWQFFSMLEQGRAVVFDRRGIPFSPIIEVVSSFKRIIKQAALFECRVGRGRLLVCSLNLAPADPAGRYLLDRIIRYAGSAAFQPAVAVSPSALAAWRAAGPGPRDFSTDQAQDVNLPKTSKTRK